VRSTNHEPHPPVTSYPLVANIILSTLFSNVLILCTSLRVGRQIAQPYRITDEIVVCFEFLSSRLKERRYGKHSPKYWHM